MSELSNKIWKFESQSRLEKAQQWFDTRKSDNYVFHVFKHKTVKG